MIRSQIVPPHRAVLYGLLFGLMAVSVRAGLQPLLGNELPFVVAFPLTVVAAVLFGWRAGACAAVVTAIAIAVPSIPPTLPDAKRPLQLGGFLVGSMLIVIFCGNVSARRADGPPLPGERFETPLTHWLRTVLWGAFLLPVIAFVIVAWWGFERTQREAESTVAHAADLAHRHAQRTFDVAAEIARRTDLAAAGDDDDVRRRESAIHQRLADITAGVPSVVNLNVWDANGRPLVRNDIFPVDPAANVSDRAYFREQKAAALPLGVSEVITGRQTGLELTNVTMRRRSSDGGFSGLVAVSVAPGYFRDYYQSLAREQPNLASFELIRLDGALIARWPPAADGRTRVTVGSEVLRRITAGERSGTLVLDDRSEHEARIVSFRRLEAYPLYVVAGVSRDAVLAGWMRFVALLAGILLPTSAGLVYVSWIALKRTRRETATALELQEEIRRRASAERSMLQSQRLETLAIVTGGVAHDFNNLLAIVSASLHVLQKKRPDLADEKNVEAMRRAIQSGVRLTRQLLSFTRKQALKPETVELQTWIPATESLIHSTLGSSVAWQASVAPDTGAIRVDLGELELALINLVVNARHAMPHGGTLTVRAANADIERTGDVPLVILSVTDTGVGIAPDVMSKVFEPFFTTRSKGVGSGLGLSQVQGFCQEAGGLVKIDSVVDRGTTVSMYLPRTQAAPEQAAAAGQPTPEVRGQVLLVEDNEDVASTSETMLRTAGMDVVRKSNAAAALAHLSTAATPPDVVLSDIAMPGSMDGIALAFLLQKERPSLPVLLTTGYAEHLSQASAGGLRVMPKPVAPDELLRALDALIKGPTASA